MYSTIEQIVADMGIDVRGSFLHVANRNQELNTVFDIIRNYLSLQH